MFLGRVDYQDLKSRGARQARELVWQASRNLKPSQLFTSILPNVYWTPSGFCWEISCFDEQIIDDPEASEANNVERRINDFMFHVQLQSRSYKTDHLIMTFGNDFTFSQSRRWFDNIDKLIRHVNARTAQRLGTSKPINVIYSTPACYLYALNQVSNINNVEWETKFDDFFPYADEPNRFWTGYFTSRPALKYNIRRTGAYLQAVRQLAALGHLNDPASADSIGTLERAMATAQHHDAVSGTEKQYVADDYAQKLSIGVEKCSGVVDFSLQSIVKARFDQDLRTKLVYCPLLNATECGPIEHSFNYTVVVYNPLARNVSAWITLPIDDVRVKIIDLETQKPVPTAETAEIYEEERDIVERRSRAQYRLVFQAAELPPLGFRTYRVEKCPTVSDQVGLKRLQTPIASTFNIKNDLIGIKFDPNGNLIAIDNRQTNVSMNVQQSFCFYESKWDFEKSERASGPYVFK